MKTIWGLGGVLVLLSAWGCSGRVQEPEEARPSPFVPAGGTGSTLPPGTSSGGSAIHIDDPEPQPGIGGSGEVGCPAVAFFSGAVIYTDALPSLSVAQSGDFLACRNDACYYGGFGTGNSFEIHPTPSTGIMVYQGADLTLGWTESDGSVLHDGDHYRLTFVPSQADVPQVVLIDGHVNYTVIDHGNCGGITKNATADERGSSGPGDIGIGGATGTDKGEGGAGGALL